MDLAQLKTVVNQKESRFELLIDGNLAKIDFKKGSKGQLYLIHTEVPEALGSKGVGHKMVREALDWIEQKEVKVVPLCPFVRSFLKQNLEDYKKIIEEGSKL
ncbi:MAG: GNAT family N-acetyltransferase [Cyclobacteriaceae bacterium]